jgi:hypothetical protein
MLAMIVEGCRSQASDEVRKFASEGAKITGVSQMRLGSCPGTKEEGKDTHVPRCGRNLHRLSNVMRLLHLFEDKDTCVGVQKEEELGVKVAEVKNDPELTEQLTL